jgi:hypothetical protein
MDPIFPLFALSTATYLGTVEMNKVPAHPRGSSKNCSPSLTDSTPFPIHCLHHVIGSVNRDSSV